MRSIHRRHSTMLVAVMMLLILLPARADAQRAFRLTAGWSQLTPRDAGIKSSGQTVMLGWLSSTTSETDVFLAYWGDADFGSPEPGVTTFGIESRYYPVEVTGVAPFLTTGFGLFQYTVPGGLLTEPSKELGFVSTMGLGLGANLTDHLWVGGEGRLRVDNGSRSKEWRLLGAYGVGKLLTPRSKPGTIEPFVIGIARLGHGPYRAQTPYAGVRFRRDETRHASAAVDIGLVGFDTDAPTPERVTVWLVQPAAEYGWTTTWGRPFVEIGPMMNGFIGGEDDGLRYGLHTGGGADIHVGESLELGLLSRVTWFQSINGRHQFGLQLGVGLGPRLMRDRSALPERAAPEQ